SGSGWWYNCLFSVALGTSSDDYANGVAVDSSGNVYAAGYTYGALDGSNAGSYDLFVVKYNSSGVKQ
ncbi:MAG: SBBP repeat-containing protein, partial [SAR324 cluster bacterium]|nr:SBBP repeat-containing protein [SAR324 cluster bacterium]